MSQNTLRICTYININIYNATGFTKSTYLRQLYWYMQILMFKIRDTWGNCHKKHLSPSSYRTFPRALVMDWLIQWQVTLMSFGLSSFPMAILKQYLNALFIGPPPALWDSQDRRCCHHHTETGTVPPRNSQTFPLHLLLPQLCEIQNMCLTQGKQMKVQLGKYFSLHPFLSVPPGPKHYGSELHPLSS